MARRKKKEDLLDRLIASFSLRGLLLHPATLYLASSAIVVGGAIACWQQYSHRILDLPSLQLTGERIAITPQPAWANVDLRQVVLGESSNPTDFNPPSLMDTGLVRDTVQSLETIGWIESVDRVQKSQLGVEIDLTYRYPVGMVELSKANVVGFQSDNIVRYHVDRNAVAMGRGLSTRPGDYLLISVGQPMYIDQVRAWSKWRDPRIEDAASICEFVKNDWKPMGLHRIVTYRSPQNSTDARVPFEFWTDWGQSEGGGVHIIWGNAPGSELSGEATADQKLEAMQLYVAKHGRFDKLTDRVIDVQTGKAVEQGRLRIRQGKQTPKRSFINLK